MLEDMATTGNESIVSWQPQQNLLLGRPATACADAGNVDHQPDEEEKLSHLVMRAFLFNQESACAVVPSPATHQRSGSEDTIVLAVDWLGLMQGGNENDLDGDEGIFFGKRFFELAESEQQC
jgi:hypothetical protein